jgi:5-methylcytosine-specific restriction endonuclease McrA
MVQTKEGAIKCAAARLGISIEEYAQHLENGEKRCYRCQSWLPVASFGVDRTRGDQRKARCLSCSRVKEKKSLKGRISTFKGQKHSEDAKKLISRARKGKSNGRLGKKHSAETRTRISQVTRERTPRGEQCHSYKDGKFVERMGQRYTLEYKRWRFDVYLRDNFTCQMCGDKRGGNLQAHHIKPFADYPDLRFEVSNGITLCKKCHNQLHRKGQ